MARREDTPHERSIKNASVRIGESTAALLLLYALLGTRPAHAIHSVCSFTDGGEQLVTVVEDDDCSDPFDPVLGTMKFGTIHAADDLTIDGTTTTNGNSNFAAGTTATFNGTAVFNGGVTLASTLSTSGISNTGNITTDTLTTNGLATLNSLSVTNNATIGGTLAVTGLATFNGGAVVTGGLTTDTLHATTVNATTVAATTVNATTVNATTSNIGTANITNALQVGSGATVNMGGNRVQNVATPIAGTDAANKNYVDSGFAALGNQVDQALAGVNTRLDDISSRTTKATAGVAMAFAMAGVPTVLPNERVAFTMNYGNFQGQNGVAINGAVRLNDNFQLTGGVGYSTEQSIVGARAGLRVGW